MRWRVGLLAGALVCAGVMMLPAGAVAAAATVTESFSPASLPLNDTSTLTFTIENPGGSLHSVVFDDTLPSGVQVADTPTTTCLSPPGVATSGGPSDLAFTDLALSDQSCTVSATVQGVQAGLWNNPVSVSIDGTPTQISASIEVAAPPSISAAFGSALLGLDGTTSLTFTIANPNADVPLTGVGFSDALPAGMVLGSPADGVNTCGGGVAGALGSSSLALAGGDVPAGGTCTVSENVTATRTGTFANTSGAVGSNEGGAGNAASAAITVVGAPSIVLSSPASGHAYAFGTKVDASYGCADAPGGPGIGTCKGDIPNGAPIDTSKAGSYSFTVTAVSRDGGVASDIVFYSVAPNNRFTVARIKAVAGGSVRLEVKLPGSGRVSVLETAGRAGRRKLTVARAGATASRARTIDLLVKPTTAGRAALTSAHTLATTLVVDYKPTGGTARTESFRVPLKS